MIRNIPIVAAFVLAAWVATARGAAPRLNEVYEAVRTNVAGLSEEQLNQAAVNALISSLAPKVSVVGSSGPGGQSGTPVSRASAFDGEIGYIRLARVASGAEAAVRGAYSALGATNKLKGLVLDLRYADGTDYAAAAALAEQFLKKERPLMDWGEGMVRSKPVNGAIGVPVAVLVNRETAGAPEAVAAVLREAGAALILGGQTAGEASVAREIPLSNGQRLRVATAPIQLGDGTALSLEGVKPDISVRVAREDERAYYADSFKVVARTNLAAADASANGTNRARRFRYNEAELVRERREGISLEEPAARENQPEKPTVQDPVLARGIDVLKGLAVIREGRS